jgi:hypothetical protein
MRGREDGQSIGAPGARVAFSERRLSFAAEPGFTPGEAT